MPVSEYIYPNSLIVRAREAWLGGSDDQWVRTLLPSDDHLRDFMDVAYHASFQREERRGIAFRIGYFTQEYLQRFQNPRISNAPQFIPFLSPRPFTTGELMRLAPAVDSTKAMLVVQDDDQGLQISGILDFGRKWWAMRRGEDAEGGAYAPPFVFTLTSFEPGNLIVSREGVELLILRNGSLSTPVSSILYEGPVASFFSVPHHEFYNEVCGKLRLPNFTGDADDNYPIRYFNDFLLGLLMRVQELGHGGSILIVRDEIHHRDSRLTDRLSIKYPCDMSRTWQVLREECVLFKEYFTHNTEMWDKPEITQAEFHKDTRNATARRELREAHDDLMTFVSGLTAVDGAVVLSDRLRLLGFGAEITAQSPTLVSVAKARDTGMMNVSTVPIDAYGTRHRSAFRFCSTLEDAVAFVISQDGGVKAVKRVGAHVVVWHDLDVTT